MFIAASYTVFMSAPLLLPLSMFAVFVLVGELNVFNAEIIFPAITLINIMRIPMMFLTPAISNAIQVLIFNYCGIIAF